MSGDLAQFVFCECAMNAGDMPNLWTSKEA